MKRNPNSGGCTPPAEPSSCRHPRRLRQLRPGLTGWFCTGCTRFLWGHIDDVVPQTLPDWAIALNAKRRAAEGASGARRQAAWPFI